MNRYIPFIVFLGLISFVRASDPNSAEYRIPDLSMGMYSYPAPDKIPDNSAALIQNFYTDIQPLAQERNGYTALDTGVGQANADGRGVWRFVDVNSNEWIIEFSSKSFYKHLLGGAPTKFGLNASSTTIPRAATNLGKIWFVNGSDYLWWFDGSSTGTVTSASLASIILAWRTRIVLANNPAANSSTIYFSADGDGTSWTIGGNPTDPFTIQIGGANDGFHVTCLGNYSDYIVAQRKYDTWIIGGTDQSDVVTRNVSSEVGCSDPGTNREFDSSYMFLSWRGIEEMRGTIIQRVSDPVRDIVDNIVKNSNSQRSITKTSQSDWAAGSVVSGNSFYIDTVTTAGRVQLTFPDTFDAYRDGTNGTMNVWTNLGGGSSVGSITAVNGQLNLATTGSHLGKETVRTTSMLSDFRVGTTFHVLISSFPADPGDLNIFQIGISTSSTLLNVTGRSFFLEFRSTNSTCFLANANDGNLDPGIFLSSVGISLPLTIDLWLSTVNFQYSFNGAVANSGAITISTGPSFGYLEWGSAAVGGSTITLDNYAVAPQTVTYQTSLYTIGSAITAWGNLDVTDSQTNPAGTIIYQFGSTNTASVSAISNFSTTTNHMVPLVSTNAFAAVRTVFNETATTGFTAFFDDITVNWLEGAAVPMASIDYDGRYWLAYTDQVGSSPVNDKTLIYQRNRTWTTTTIPAASFAIWRDHLYFGDSASNGNFYQFDVGNNDNGSAINSIINFKSYDYNAGHRDKDLNRAYVAFLGNPIFVSTFTMGYIVDQGSVTYPMGMANMNDGLGQVNDKFWFNVSSGPLQAQEVQYVLNKTGTGDRLKLFDIVTNYRVKEER